MPLEHLRIDAVRCLNDVVIDLDPRRNYLWGPNGAGKTSFLESIYLLARGRSFRVRINERLLQRGRDRLQVYGRVRTGDDRIRRLGIEFSGSGLVTRLDGEPAASQAEMLRLLPVHVIDPRLHRLVEAGPSERRRFLDAGVFHVEHGFLEAWRDFRRALAQRNAALKGGAADAEIEVWTERFTGAAERVHRRRLDYVDRLRPLVAEQSTELLGDSLSLDYAPGWRSDRTLADVLAGHRDRDRRLGYTQAGPHRADLELSFEHGGVREVASRGQQKLVAAALVIAQVRLFEQSTTERGVLLVDDASAELDRASQDRLLAGLDRLRSQQILTGLSADSLRPDPAYPLFHVEQGRVRQVV